MSLIIFSVPACIPHAPKPSQGDDINKIDSQQTQPRLCTVQFALRKHLVFNVFLIFQGRRLSGSLSRGTIYSEETTLRLGASSVLQSSLPVSEVLRRSQLTGIELRVDRSGLPAVTCTIAPGRIGFTVH